MHQLLDPLEHRRAVSFDMRTHHRRGPFERQQDDPPRGGPLADRLEEPLDPGRKHLSRVLLSWVAWDHVFQLVQRIELLTLDQAAQQR